MTEETSNTKKSNIEYITRVFITFIITISLIGASVYFAVKGQTDFAGGFGLAAFISGSCLYSALGIEN